MQLSFTFVISFVTFLLPTILLCILLPVLLSHTDEAQRSLLQILSREVAHAMSEGVSGYLDAGQHQVETALRITRLIRASPFQAGSPPAPGSKGYSASEAATLGLYTGQYRLWLDRETVLMQVYHKCFTYLAGLTFPLSSEVAAAEKALGHRQLMCSFSNGDTVYAEWGLEDGVFHGETQLAQTDYGARVRSPWFHVPTNVTGSIWNADLVLEANRDPVLRHLANNADSTIWRRMPPAGAGWLSQKALAPLLEEAKAEASRNVHLTPLVNDEMIEMISAAYPRRSVELWNQSVWSTITPEVFDVETQTNCFTWADINAVASTASTLFFKAFRSQAAPDMEKQPVFYIVDGRGAALYSSEKARFVTVAVLDPSVRHPAEDTAGCFSVVFTVPETTSGSGGGSSGRVKRVYCERNETDFELLYQLQQQTDLNLSDFREAMLVANHSASEHRRSVPAEHSFFFRTASVEHGGVRWEVTAAPLVTESPMHWHYSIVIFVPEDYLRGPIEDRRNIAIGISVAICCVAVLIAAAANFIVAARVRGLVHDMGNPFELHREGTKRGEWSPLTEQQQQQQQQQHQQNKKRIAGRANFSSGPAVSPSTSSTTSKDTDSSVDSSNCRSGLERWLRQACFAMQELEHIQTEFDAFRETIEKLRGFVDRRALREVMQTQRAKRGGESNHERKGTFLATASNSMESSSPTHAPAAAHFHSLADDRASSSVEPTRKRKSVKFSSPSPSAQVSPSGSSGEHAPLSPLMAPPQGFAAIDSDTDASTSSEPDSDALSGQHGSNQQQEGAAATADNEHKKKRHKRKQAYPLNRKSDPKVQRLFGCVVVAFPGLQTLMAQASLALSADSSSSAVKAGASPAVVASSSPPSSPPSRPLPAAEDILSHSDYAAKMCNNLLERLPVTSIEFMGDGLIFAFHMRSLTRRSRILTMVVSELVRQAKQFQQDVEEHLELEQRHHHDDKHSLQSGPQRKKAEKHHADSLLVAAGVFCGVLRFSLHQHCPSSADGHEQQGLRRATFVGSAVANASAICHNVGCVSEVRTNQAVDAIAGVPFRMSDSEAAYVDGSSSSSSAVKKTAASPQPPMRRIRWQREMCPVVGAYGLDGQSATITEGTGKMLLRYSINMPRCLVGLTAPLPVNPQRQQQQQQQQNQEEDDDVENGTAGSDEQNKPNAPPPPIPLITNNLLLLKAATENAADNKHAFFSISRMVEPSEKNKSHS